MLLSSRLSCRGRFSCPGPVVPQQCPEDIDAAAGEGDHGLGVCVTWARFFR